MSDNAAPAQSGMQPTPPPGAPPKAPTPEPVYAGDASFGKRVPQKVAAPRSRPGMKRGGVGSGIHSGVDELGMSTAWKDQPSRSKR